MRCLLHTELRQEDLAVLSEIGLLPALNAVVARLHGWESSSGATAAGDGNSAAHMTQQQQQETRHRSLARSTDTIDSRQLARTAQLLYHTLASRFAARAHRLPALPPPQPPAVLCCARGHRAAPRLPGVAADASPRGPREAVRPLRRKKAQIAVAAEAGAAALARSCSGIWPTSRLGCAPSSRPTA